MMFLMKDTGSVFVWVYLISELRITIEKVKHELVNLLFDTSIIIFDKYFNIVTISI